MLAMWICGFALVINLCWCSPLNMKPNYLDGDELVKIYPPFDPFAPYQNPINWNVLKRNNNFLRFGRREQYPFLYRKPIPSKRNLDLDRLTRSAEEENNDHFIRFGRTERNKNKLVHSKYIEPNNQRFIIYGGDEKNVKNFSKALHPIGGIRSITQSRNTLDQGIPFRRITKNDGNFLRFGRNELLKKNELRG